MALSKTKKVLLIIASSIVFVLIVVILIINSYLGNIIESKIRDGLNKTDTNFEVSIRDVRFNIISGNLKILDLVIKPDSSFLELVKKGEAPVGTIQGAEVPVFKIAGIQLYKAIVNGYISLRKIEFKDAHVTFYKGKKPKKETKERSAEKVFRTDSIYIKGLDGIDLSKIVFDKCMIDVFDLVNEKYIMQSGEVDILLTDIDLIEWPEKNDVFKFGFDKFKLDMSIDEFKLPGGWYNLHVKNFLFSKPDSSLKIKGLKYWPQYANLDNMARDLKFTKEIFNVNVKSIDVFQVKAERLINEGEVYIDSILVTGLKLNILKDKKYPFNEKLRPKLLNELLRTMDLPLNIQKVKIEESELVYKEKNEGTKEKMTVSLNDLQADLNNITSVKDSIKNGAIFRINLYAKLMNRARMDVHFVMPLRSTVDTFFYSGYLGPSDFRVYNQAIVPALGVEFKEGKINSLHFEGSANRNISKGKMTMRYEGLVAEVYKKDSKNKNKFMTWAANTAVRSQNPGKKGKLIIAHIDFERVMYKGFGNLIWKSVQSGLVNTVAPTGKHDKIDVSDTDNQSKEEVKQEAPEKEKPEKKKRKNKR